MQSHGIGTVATLAPNTCVWITIGATIKDKKCRSLRNARVEGKSAVFEIWKLTVRPFPFPRFIIIVLLTNPEYIPPSILHPLAARHP